MRRHHQQRRHEMASKSTCKAMHRSGKDQRKNHNPRYRVSDPAMVREVACGAVELADEIDIGQAAGNDRCPDRILGAPLQPATRHAQADERMC